MHKFTINRDINPDSWDQLVEASPEGSIFMKHGFLEASHADYELLTVSKGEVIKAGFLAVRSPGSDNCIQHDLIIYSGIFFIHDKKKKPARARLERFEITEFLIEVMTEMYGNIEFSLSPHFEDVRPFLWFNYHSELPGSKFSLDIRYTSYLDIRELGCVKKEEDTQVFKNLIRLRQRCIRKMRKLNSSFQESDDPEILSRMYCDMMKRKNDEPDPDKLTAIQNLASYLINSENGNLYTVSNENGQTVYAILFARDSKRAYALFAAGIEESKDMYEGTIAYWDSFHSLASCYDVKEVDLEGVNSPQRGWFKMGFGGILLPYYEINLKR